MVLFTPVLIVNFLFALCEVLIVHFLFALCEVLILHFLFALCEVLSVHFLFALCDRRLFLCFSDRSKIRCELRTGSTGMDRTDIRYRTGAGEFPSFLINWSVDGEKVRVKY